MIVSRHAVLRSRHSSCGDVGEQIIWRDLQISGADVWSSCSCWSNTPNPRVHYSKAPNYPTAGSAICPSRVCDRRTRSSARSPKISRLSPLNCFADFGHCCRSSAPKSKAEMEALAELPHVEAQSSPGTLGLYEEFAPDIAALILPFLKRS